MKFQPTFFYNDDNNAGGGGNEGNPDNVNIAPIITTDELKEYGVSADQLKDILRQHKENSIPDAEKQKAEQSKKADLVKFAAENDYVKVEEWTTYDNIKSKPDRELRFESFVQEWKEDNPDITDPEEIQTQAKADFESEYKLTSENAKQKARGEARLKKDAEELRNPIVSKVKQAEQSFSERKALEGKFPEFNKFVDSLIEKCTPEKLSISKVKDDKDEIPIEVELTKADRDELAKIFRTPKTFQAFSSETDPKKIEAAVTKKINGYLKEKYFDTAIGKSYETGKGIGMKNGSTVGAENLFGIVKGGSHPDNAAAASVMEEIWESHKKVAGKNK